MPGISRSGISISAGLFLGLDRASAARFSFLMATPVTAGAALFEIRRLVAGDVPFRPDAGVLAVGVAASFIAGLIAIHFLLAYVPHELDAAVRGSTAVGLAALLVLWMLG